MNHYSDNKVKETKVLNIPFDWIARPFEIRVNFEDVDAGQVVYHPNYLKYYERARMHWMEDKGYSFSEMLKDQKAFVAANLNIRYFKPLVFGQKLWVNCRVREKRKSAVLIDQWITMHQHSEEELHKIPDEIHKIPKLVNMLEARWVCVDLKTFKPGLLPEGFLNAFSGHNH